MDSSANEPRSENEPLKRIAAALQGGIVVVDGTGNIVWMDRNARRRVNGELNNLVLPLVKPARDELDCFVAPVELEVDGERVTLGIIQVEERRQSPDVIATIESVLADSTSWFTRTIIEKLKAVSPPKAETGAGNGTVQLDSLSAREREVLGLICEGHSDVQMAKLLGLSENTVRNHIAGLYRKIGVNRRTAAVIWARERGISCRDDLKLMGGARRARDGNTGNGHDNGRTPS
jgi:DNA-binding CsgD family transcriptional regulator